MMNRLQTLGRKTTAGQDRGTTQAVRGAAEKRKNLKIFQKIISTEIVS